MASQPNIRWLERELEDAAKVVDAAREIHKQLKTSVKSLTRRKEQIARSLNRHKAARRKLGRGAPKSHAESSAEYALRATQTMISRNRDLVKRQQKTVRDKEAILRRLKRQSEKLSQDIVDIRRYDVDPSSDAQANLSPVHGEHLAAARGLMGLSKQDFAAALGLSLAKYRVLEVQQGELALAGPEAERIRQTLADAGIELIPPGIYVGNGGCGVRLGKATTDSTADKHPKSRKGARRKRRLKKIA